MGTTESEDGVGTADGPEHAGLFEAGADDGFAASLHDPRADEQVLAAELGVAHARGVGLKVVGFGVNLFSQAGIEGSQLAQRENQFLDLAFVQQAFLVDLHPSRLLACIVGIEQARDAP